jgi:iron-sulfur cluster repair protein YtfE (RIC family)
MASTCGCGSTTTAREVSSTERIHAELRVGDVTARDAGALEIMQRLGINHCCGAGLTLAEAAASAGVPLDRLLQALNDRTGAAS